MRNEIKTSASGAGSKRGWGYLALVSLGGFSNGSFAMDNLELILDGHAYTVNSNVNININQQTIFIAESDLFNCLRPDNLPPLNNASMTLIANNQDIGIEQFRYFVEGRLLFLTSETSNLICDNGAFVDQIFVQGFESPVSPFLIFGNGFDN